MYHTTVPRRTAVRRRLTITLAISCLVGLTQVQADQEPVRTANYKQAFKYSAEYLRQFVYSTSVTPHWIGKTDAFWYSFRTSGGTAWYKVNPKQPAKEPLFDHVKLATLLSETTQKPVEANSLPLTRESINDEGTKFKFVIEDVQYEFDLAGEKLANLGKAPPARPAFGAPGGREDFQQRREEFLRQQEEQQRRDQQDNQQQRRDQQDTDQQRRGFRRGLGDGGPGFRQRPTDYRVFSPDRKAYLFIRNHDLCLLELGEKSVDSLLLPTWAMDTAGAMAQLWTLSRGNNWLKETKAVQLTADGAEDYSFGRMATFGSGMDDGIDPPRVEWSKDSKSFYATRVDTRGVQDLFLVNSLAMPRPTLEKYKYPMPGEDAARRMELFVGDRAAKKLARIKPKWKDEAYTNIHWGKTTDELRFVRRDRLWRHGEFCTANAASGETKCLILEGFENANLNFEPVYYIDETDEMIWWSERSGWGHYYLYERNGKFKNAITTGLYRASRVVDVDAKNRLLFFQANGREHGENIYFNHLYCVHLDGTGLTLMDPGNATHQSNLSPSHQYVVDNCSRVDMAPISLLRDAGGKQIMELEKADMSRLLEVGWKMPETFVVKAADGVTDLFGDMWKPFDFDPKKRYPVIANVYPGPQSEGVTHNFSAVSPNQQMAQLGFIVIQVGHRGGTPTRSKAYGSYGYFNMRDYGLADKKTAIEQLAARYSFIDLDRVGIYGHSGGGFMSAAAVLQKPYNEFFKAAVASAGNHDNNIYNNGWAERYHGMKEVAVNGSAVLKNSQTAAGNGGINAAATNRAAEQNGSAESADDASKESAQKTGSGTSGQKDENGETRFDIKVPTNAELAANLKGSLLLVHGEMDNNVHPANTMRLVDALIKANKRFDMLILPGKRHGFADYQPYFQQRMWDFFADHLLGDRQTGSDILEKRENSRGP